MTWLDQVVLVDEFGHDLFSCSGQISTMDKIEVHRRGLLHRAISVFIFNYKNELLLQKRDLEKYHSPGKWSNTCCTHPLPGETPFSAAVRRLKEEMGLNTHLTEAFTFSYRADVGDGLVENEFDHVFIGICNENPKPDVIEVAEWQWVKMEELKREIIKNPQEYTPWLRQCFNKVLKSYILITIETEEH